MSAYSVTIRSLDKPSESQDQVWPSALVMCLGEFVARSWHSLAWDIFQREYTHTKA